MVKDIRHDNGVFLDIDISLFLYFFFKWHFSKIVTKKIDIYSSLYISVIYNNNFIRGLSKNI